MDMNLTFTDFAIVGITVLAVIIAVTLHHEVSTWMVKRLDSPSQQRHRRMLYLIFTLILTHIAQIWLFASAAHVILMLPDSGSIVYSSQVNFLDLVYLSAVTFTTLGYGDILPVGSIRFLFGTLSLTGFTLITWSASITFLEMQRQWKERLDSRL
ncbi:two pore domain potassium channel family protein [Aliidiomarina soli]|uniref:Two pore domain potassium channel family protein n=2 Tax=Aliidiomarina soli TaxID=1928574 RepID=A0A432WDZ2_9GAMM|nr:two pore domain potassium channel family protein [Aliidiomarina soli]